MSETTDNTEAGFVQLSWAETVEMANLVRSRHETRFVAGEGGTTEVRCSCGEVFPVSRVSQEAMTNAVLDHISAATRERARSEYKRLHPDFDQYRDPAVTDVIPAIEPAGPPRIAERFYREPESQRPPENPINPQGLKLIESLSAKIVVWTLTLEAENEGISTTVHATDHDAENWIRESLRMNRVKIADGLTGGQLFQAWTANRNGRCILDQHLLDIRGVEALQVARNAREESEAENLVAELFAMLRIDVLHVKTAEPLLARAEAFLKHGDENFREVDEAGKHGEGMNDNLWHILQEVLTAVDELPGVRDKIDCFMRGRGSEHPEAEYDALRKVAF